MSLYDLADNWRAALVGQEVSGTVTDPETENSLAYHWCCTAVSYSGFGDRIALTFDDLLTGSYHRLERTEAQLERVTPAQFGAEFAANVVAELEEQLAASQYADLEEEM